MTKKGNDRGGGKAFTLRRIIESARQEFAEKGLEKAHIQAIAESAGVTKQLIYHYFVNKEGLFACVLDESSDEAMSELLESDFDHLPPEKALRAMLYQMFDQFRDNPTLSSLSSEGIRYHDSHDTPRNRFLDLGPLLTLRMGKIITRGVEAGLFRKDINSKYIFATAGLMVSGAYSHRYLIQTLGGIDPTSEEMAESWKEFTVTLILSALKNLD